MVGGIESKDLFQAVKASDSIGINRYAVHNSLQQYDSLIFGLAQGVKVSG